MIKRASMLACEYFRQKQSMIDIIEFLSLQVAGLNSDGGMRSLDFIRDVI
jgi:hypothetical protein